MGQEKVGSMWNRRNKQMNKSWCLWCYSPVSCVFLGLFDSTIVLFSHSAAMGRVDNCFIPKKVFWRNNVFGNSFQWVREEYLLWQQFRGAEYSLLCGQPALLRGHEVRRPLTYLLRFPLLCGGRVYFVLGDGWSEQSCALGSAGTAIVPNCWTLDKEDSLLSDPSFAPTTAGPWVGIFVWIQPTGPYTSNQH